MWSEQGVVIGYDARYNSKLFAELCSIVFLNNNFRVHLFGNYVATPFVPFAILELGCLAGIMVTGCHYPKNINGLKVSFSLSHSHCCLTWLFSLISRFIGQTVL